MTTNNGRRLNLSPPLLLPPLLLLALLLVAGCDALPQHIPADSGNRASANINVNGEPPSATESAESAESADRSQSQYPPPPLVAASDALGLHLTQARDFFLAPPNQVVFEGEVVLWQYKSKACVLEAAFWKNNNEANAQLRNLSARNRNNGHSLESPEPCLNDVRAENNENRASENNANSAKRPDLNINSESN